MIHSFDCINNKNGNITVSFTENNKLRKIIFTKGTAALSMLEDYLWDDASNNSSDNIIHSAIMFMKKVYYFKANKNNSSIFRPMDKALILKLKDN